MFLSQAFNFQKPHFSFISAPWSIRNSANNLWKLKLYTLDDIEVLFSSYDIKFITLILSVSEKRSSYRGVATPDNLAKQMSFDSLPPGRGSPKTPCGAMRHPQPPPPRHMTPNSGRSTPNKYNNFDHYPQPMNMDPQPRQLYNPRHYPAYHGQQSYHGQSPSAHSKQLRHHLSQQQLQQLQQQQLSQQQLQIQQQMQQRKLLQQQQQRLAQKQQQEMWLRQQPLMPQHMHHRSTPPQHGMSHQLQNCEVTKHRSNSECSSNSGSSLRLDQDRTPGNSSPQSSVSSTSGSGTDLLHELKNRQTRRSNNKENNINKVPEPHSGACPSPKLTSSPKAHPSPKPRHKAPGSLPQKPVIPALRHQTNGSSTNFCAVNPTSRANAGRNNLLDSPGPENPAARAASPAEDFSFETILLRAKGNEKKNNTLPKPVPPPKPKINL